MKFKIGDKVKFEPYVNGYVLKGTIESISGKSANIIVPSIGKFFMRINELRLDEIDKTYNDVLKQCTVNRDSTGKVCTCDSRALFNHGCRCGAIERYDVNKHWR